MNDLFKICDEMELEIKKALLDVDFVSYIGLGVAILLWLPVMWLKYINTRLFK